MSDSAPQKTSEDLVLSVEEAANLAGVAKGTLYRFIREGRLQTVRRPNGRLGVSSREIASLGALEEHPGEAFAKFMKESLSSTQSFALSALSSAKDAMTRTNETLLANNELLGKSLQEERADRVEKERELRGYRSAFEEVLDLETQRQLERDEHERSQNRKDKGVQLATMLALKKLKLEPGEMERLLEVSRAILGDSNGASEAPQPSQEESGAPSHTNGAPDRTSPSSAGSE